MSTATPKFSIIIPTKDRAEYLRHTLRTCSIQEYTNLEIIVSDDGSVDHTKTVVEEAAKRDPRICYITPGKNVGMLENFEFALDSVKEGYVIALGGDDAILPYGISRMHEILTASGQSMLAWPTAIYYYPGVKMKTGQFIYPIGSGKSKQCFRLVNSEEFLERQVKNLSYLTDSESPMFYVKGVVSIDLINKVKDRTVGRKFYSCPTPDGYSGIVLAGETSTWAYTDCPLTMHGLSPTSQGTAYLLADEKSKKLSQEFFKKSAALPMHKELASQDYSPLITVMTADYLLTAKDLPGWQGNVGPIDYKKLLNQALDELADGLFAASNLGRELHILEEIAKFHGLSDYFERLLKSKKRNSKKVLEGNAISPKRIYFHAEQLGIYNVFDAAYTAYLFSKSRLFISLKSFIGVVKNSVKYRLQFSKAGTEFPPRSEWLNN